MNALIILAHPEADSTNARLAEVARERLADAGWEVETLDLYAEDFDPVEHRRHFPAEGAEARFDVQGFQRRAFQQGELAREVERSFRMVSAADLIVFQYPVWWWGPPAILKGWFDRVWMYGATYSSKRRFERGPFAGKRAFVSVTHGASQSACAHNGHEGDSRLAIWPMLMTLHYVGLTVLEPLIVHGIGGDGSLSRLEERRATASRKLADRIDALDSSPVVTFNRWDDFDTEHRLKPKACALSPFVRHVKELALC